MKEKDYIVKKRRYSAFFGTDLDLTLRELRVEKLYLTGVLTNICVLHTAGDAVLRGYEVSIIRDCTAALSDYDYEYAINHMKNVFQAEIIDLNELVSRGSKRNEEIKSEKSEVKKISIRLDKHYHSSIKRHMC